MTSPLSKDKKKEIMKDIVLRLHEGLSAEVTRKLEEKGFKVRS